MELHEIVSTSGAALVALITVAAVVKSLVRADLRRDLNGKFVPVGEYAIREANANLLLRTHGERVDKIDAKLERIDERLQRVEKEITSA